MDKVDRQEKVYLFIKDTDYESGKLTGAHRRFIELVKGVSKTSKVILVSFPIPQLSDLQNISFVPLKKIESHFLPKHIRGMISICKTLLDIKKHIYYDYAISFGQTYSVCYKLCGYKNVVSLFREDLIEYLKVVNASKLKIMYFRVLECVAINASKKVIVQCKNDKENLIQRNRNYCKNIDSKVVVQINNANASWMKKQSVNKEHDGNAVKILFIGDFSNKRKGHEILLPAVSRLIEEGEEIELLIAGDGIEKEVFEKQYIKHAGIKFLGRINDVDSYLGKANFMVVPSFIDSCPNTILEGLNAGVAVYGANTGGIPDLLEEQKYMFEPNENSLHVFLKDIIERKAYIQDAKEQEQKKKKLTFDWADKVKTIIEE